MANKVHFFRRLKKLTCAHNFVWLCPCVPKFTGSLDAFSVSLFVRDSLNVPKIGYSSSFLRLKNIR